MNAETRSFGDACAKLHLRFFTESPDEQVREFVDRMLPLLLEQKADFPGPIGEWAGGIVYFAGLGQRGASWDRDAALERVFGAPLSAIRRRATEVRDSLRSHPSLLAGTVGGEPFTLRDEANAMCAYAFRNGPMEDIHADGRITDPEMKQLMINASERLAHLLAMKQSAPGEYEQLIRKCHRDFCRVWER